MALQTIAIYQAEDGSIFVDVRLSDETVWLSLNQIADLFQKDKSVISRHLKNLFKEGELEAEAVVAKFATTAKDGKTYQVEHFNLDAILSIGYRVNSKRGTQFRKWAAQSVILYAFNVLEATALFAGHHPQNTASARMLEKLGFRYTHDELYAPTGLYHPSYLLSRS